MPPLKSARAGAIVAWTAGRIRTPMAQAPAAPSTSSPGLPPQPDDGTPPLYGFFVGCGILTAVVWLNMVVQFLMQSPSLDKASNLNLLYFMVLGLYGGAKHVTPPAPEQQDARVIRGSFFVWWWIGTCGLMALMAENGWFGLHKMPHDILTVPATVFSIFLTGKVAKAYLPRGRGWKSGAAAPGRTAPVPAPEPDSPEPAPADPYLQLLEKFPDGLTTADFARKLRVSASTVRTRIHELLAADAIEKVSAGPNDPHTRYRLKRAAPEPEPKPAPDWDFPPDEPAPKPGPKTPAPAPKPAPQTPKPMTPPMGQDRVLDKLWTAPTGFTLDELARELKMRPTVLQPALDERVHSGLVKLVPPASPGDKPRYVLTYFYEIDQRERRKSR